MSLSRRRFLATTAAVVASPAWAAAPSEVDVAIVGAGAAGIAAARRVASLNRKFALLEAADVVGGRCVTDTQTFGVPFDRGAHWIHMPDINPVATLATRAGIDIYGAPPGQKLRLGRRYAREAEMEDYLSMLVRANQAIRDAARKGESSCAQALPKELGEWRPTVEFFLGPFGCGRDLADISAQDFARSAERDIDAFCRLGYGAMLAKLAEGMPVQRGAAVTRIDWSGRGNVEIDTTQGRVSARAVVVTVSTGVLLSGRIKFNPEIPKRQLDAIARLPMASYDHIALELPGNPLGLQRDDLMFEKSDSPRTAAMLANLAGTNLCFVDVGGKFGRDLAVKGEQEMVNFALDWLNGLYGIDGRASVKRTSATRWNHDPLALGAFSVAMPGGQPSRKILMEPINNRIWFAGEAAHETLWGTVGGAWESGERAANDLLKKIGVIREPEAPEAKQKARSRRR